MICPLLVSSFMLWLTVRNLVLGDDDPTVQQALAADAQQVVADRFVVPFWPRALCPSVNGQRCWAQLNRRSVVRRGDTVQPIARYALALLS